MTAQGTGPPTSRRRDRGLARARDAGHASGGMPTLLIVHHTPSPPLHSMLESVVSGAGNDQLSGVEVKVRPALTASPVDVLGADGYILGTPVNLGYMSGALKHFFDQIYYPCLDATAGRPYGLYGHGDTDATGAARAVDVIAPGL